MSSRKTAIDLALPLTITQHASDRMSQNRLRKKDVQRTIWLGDWRSVRHGRIMYSHRDIVVVTNASTDTVITAYRDNTYGV